MPDFPEFNRDKALIFRIVHRDNVPWLLDNGLHCRNSGRSDPDYVAIGDPELIEKRRHRTVPIPPGGTLGDYVPFYFTPRSPMLMSICSGYRGLRRYDPSEIVIVTAPLRDLARAGIAFVFTDGHAYMQTTTYFDDLARLDRIDWDLLQSSEFRRSDEDPGRMNRYQAEALVHKAMRLDGLGALGCYDDVAKAMISRWVAERGLEIKVFKRSSWYFA